MEGRWGGVVSVAELLVGLRDGGSLGGVEGVGVWFYEGGNGGGGGRGFGGMGV